jgi:hypothetical protein
MGEMAGIYELTPTVNDVIQILQARQRGVDMTLDDARSIGISALVQGL